MGDVAGDPHQHQCAETAVHPYHLTDKHMRRLFVIILIVILAVIVYEFATFPDVEKLAKETPRTTAFMDGRGARSAAARERATRCCISRFPTRGSRPICGAPCWSPRTTRSTSMKGSTS